MVIKESFTFEEFNFIIIENVINVVKVKVKVKVDSIIMMATIIMMVIFIAN